MKRRVTGFIMAIALFFGNVYPVYGDDLPYFVGVNDVLIPMQASTLPIWVGTYMYLPHTVFDSATYQSKLGLSSNYQPANNLLTVYNIENTMIFDIEGEFCTNANTQETYPYRAVIRDGVPFVPVTVICNFFNLNYSYHKVEQGYLLRIESPLSTLSDDTFVRYYDQRMAKMLEEFRQGPMPTITPSTPTVVDTQFLMGFFQDADGADFIDTLEQWKVKGLFFFHLESLTQQGHYLRKLYATGHSIGIQLTAQTTQAQEEELGKCLEVLRGQTLGTTVYLALPEGSDKAHWESQGYFLWGGGTGKEVDDPETLVNSLPQGNGMVYLSIRPTETTREHWLQLMNTLGEAHFFPQIPTERTLGG